MVDNLPILPYNGSSGYSGTDTSQERANYLDQSGITATNQKLTIQLLEGRGEFGVTWMELCDCMTWHHGTSSSVLSVLHKKNVIDRLKETRGRSHVYVLPKYRNGRDLDPIRRKICPHCANEI